jgi:hypothetical protein
MNEATINSTKMNQTTVLAAAPRYLLGLWSGIAFALLVGFAGIVSGPAVAFGAEPAAQEANNVQAARTNSAEPVYRVVSPLGDSKVTMVAMGPRLDTLEGKTVCLVWNHAFKADITFPAIAESLKSKYRNIKIVPYTEIDAAIRAAGGDFTSPEPALLAKVFKEKGCDAVISGNGG